MVTRLFRSFLLLCLLLVCRPGMSQQPGINYDEAAVPAYSLPDPLLTPAGKPVRSVTGWEREQRPHLLRQFAEHVYGKTPDRKLNVRYEVRSVDANALNGTAVRKQVAVFWTDYPQLPPLEILLYTPKNTGGSRPPVFVGLNYFGNQCVSTDPGILLSTRWMMNAGDGVVVDHRATEASRGFQARRWPLDLILSKGYAVATAYYGDLEPDHPEGWKTGIRSVLDPPVEGAPDRWKAIGVWAWGMSRMLDYLETDPSVDVGRAIAVGHSRQGKAALWAGAQDPRFDIVLSNDSGEGGAALSRRIFGETIEKLNTSFPHWFCDRYRSYNNRPEALPVDQHELLALMAPRPLYVASAREDQWADPKGEFTSARKTDPVYALYGKKGIGTDQMPGLHQPTGETVRYHIREGKHDILRYDWEQYIEFADRHLRTNR
ncbi:glucuronyl esterase domain-containing protein [Larkinella soli]|uniref:glucuronyl esterase domain-containing protein n=1 Tax=Larkinella soli TaxID=1770527 RepID=UPI001E4E8F73|nr:acetylxylan esterase [Larkinella soli]